MRRHLRRISGHCQTTFIGYHSSFNKEGVVLTTMLSSEETSHWKSWQFPPAAPATVHSCDAFAGSLKEARTWSPLARSWRTHSRPMPLLAPTISQIAIVKGAGLRQLLQRSIQRIIGSDLQHQRNKHHRTHSQVIEMRGDRKQRYTLSEVLPAL